MSNSNSFDYGNSNSLGTDEAAFLPWFFRHTMPIPVTLVSGI